MQNVGHQHADHGPAYSFKTGSGTRPTVAQHIASAQRATRQPDLGSAHSIKKGLTSIGHEGRM
eukprot:2535473-Rhodomonas_salina.1